MLKWNEPHLESLRKMGTVSSYSSFAKNGIESRRVLLASKQCRDNFNLQTGTTLKAYVRED
jgi:hypothetical protein